MTPSSRLPPGWSAILDEIARRLEDSVAAADVRMTQMPALETEQLAQRRVEDAARLEACLQGLSGQLASAEELVQDVDTVLRAAEELLQEQITSSGSLRQRLAEVVAAP